SRLAGSTKIAWPRTPRIHPSLAREDPDMIAVAEERRRSAGPEVRLVRDHTRGVLDPRDEARRNQRFASNTGTCLLQWGERERIIQCLNTIFTYPVKSATVCIQWELE